MSYINLHLTYDEMRFLIEGKTNEVRVPIEISPKKGDFTVIRDRMYRIIYLKGKGKAFGLVGLGFMGMYGDEE